MCGIFGLSIKKDISPTDVERIKKDVTRLFKLSESRGKEASGLAILANNNIKVFKDSLTASVLIRQPKFNELFEKLNSPLTIIGHARLATNGALERNNNNQPVIKDGLVGIHNGIITNDDALVKKFYLKRENEVDTEIFLALVRYYLKKKETLSEATRETFKQIEGAASVGIIFNDYKNLILATNTGSLYYQETKEFFVFASEKYILEKFLKREEINNIFQLKPDTGLILNLRNFNYEKFDFKTKDSIIATEIKNKVKIIDLSSYPPTKQIIAKPLVVPQDIIDNVSQNLKKISSLRRCSRCLLPETMPFIEFDEKGVCNYCHNYKKMKVKNIAELKKTLNLEKDNRDDRPDCLMTFSGGRDSSFGLHYFKKVLKANPISYSYDWGMITDLGRRNQARMTGKLGIEHILVSADIKKKRESIRKNVQAWLRRPDVGTVPLFMAGDKQYFYYANKIGKRIGASSIVLCINPLEKTDFKFGFCGVRPNVNIQYRLSLFNQIKISLYYLKQYLLNPFFFNSSLFDTIFAFISFYSIPHNYVFFYQFKRWNEKEINQTLIKKYNWEIAQDTKTTWRIGDGTAAFYNYIYLIMAGFTENDTFRSNQIREGDISRGDALKLLEEGNKIRYESIKWYCDTIGIDFFKTLRTINKAPKKY